VTDESRGIKRSRTERVRVLGIGFDPLTLQEAADRVQEFVASGKPHMVVTPNPEIVYTAQFDSNLRHVLLEADLVTADGTGIVWAAGHIGQPVPERVTGIELAEEVMRRAAASGYGLYLLGAGPGVAEEAAVRLAERFPGLRIVGTHHGYFGPDQEPAVLDAVRSARPDLLFVGLGAARQEKWMAAHGGELGVPASIGLGGCLDVWAGRLARAPLLFRRLRLEWLYRLGKEPRRFWRMVALPKFVQAVRRYGPSPIGEPAPVDPRAPGPTVRQQGGIEANVSDKHQDLKDIALSLRRDILEMTTAAKSGHATSSLSAVELLTALFFRVMKLDPKNPDWPERDRFLLSKGHASPVLYSAMAERGFFPKDELGTFRRLNSRLQGHPTVHKLPGVEIASGSLGQGLSQGVGMALGGKMDRANWRVYVVLGDGELQEGQNWEAAMAAPFYKLDNLCAIVDYNGLETDGPIEQIMGLHPLDEKFRAFNWHVINIDGHDFDQILQALEEAAATRGKPTMILAKTLKGKGVSFLENALGWHGVPPKPEDLEKALKELV